MFITEQDYIQVSADALRIIQQATDDNRLLAERRAMDRIASYLDGRYDMQALSPPKAKQGTSTSWDWWPTWHSISWCSACRKRWGMKSGRNSLKTPSPIWRRYRRERRS